MSVVQILLGASICLSLQGFVDLEVIGLRGLHFLHPRLKEVLNRIKSKIKNQKKVQIYYIPFGNSLFPGQKVKGKNCYIKHHSLKGLSAHQMAFRTSQLFKKIEKLSPKTEIQFIVLPSIGRRGKKCHVKCNDCISFPQFGDKLTKYQLIMEEQRERNISVVSIKTMEEFFYHSDLISTNFFRTLRKLRNDFSLKKCSEEKMLSKLYLCFSGLLISCKDKRVCENVKGPDRIHICCAPKKRLFARFIQHVSCTHLANSVEHPDGNSRQVECGIPREGNSNGSANE